MYKITISLCLSILMLLSIIAEARASSTAPFSPAPSASPSLASPALDSSSRLAGTAGLESAWQTSADGAVSVRLFSAVTGTGQMARVPLGLDIILADGWKTYWRFPGSAGFPPRFDWTGSTNIDLGKIDLGNIDSIDSGAGSVEQIQWPVPSRHETLGLQGYGYDTHVILPLSLPVQRVGEAVSLKARLEMMACSDLCVPFDFDLSLSVPAGEALPSLWVDQLRFWQQRVPVEEATPASRLTGRPGLLGIKQENDGFVLAVSSPVPLENPDVFLDGVVTKSPEVLGKENPVLLRLPFTGANETQFVGQRLRVTLVETAQGGVPLRWSEATLEVAAGEGSASSSPSSPSTSPLMQGAGSMTLWAALAAAFIGGMILNLMPCVLPVLSLKILAIVRHRESDLAHIRKSFLASALGIVTSFLVLALLALSLRHAGIAIGWGAQFQSPWFLGGMTILLTLFTASLWNLIHIPLPGFFATLAVQDISKNPKHEMLGHFLAGAFATVLATPCSAPFVGTALGFALTAGDIAILLVALFMGGGLAVPYLLIAAMPKLARYLPKPGAWMGVLQAVLGFALLITAVWLANLFGRAATDDPVASQALSGSALLLLLVLWVRAALRRPVLFGKGIVAIALVIFSLDQLGRLETRFTLDNLDAPHVNWTLFDRGAIPSLVQSGKVVFVDVTASWCLTCKANEIFVLGRSPVVEALVQADVVAMKADWTNRNVGITEYLAAHGRAGIPFYVVYGPAAPEGIVLPELVTADHVQAALDSARGDAASARNE